ncbi:GlxA family transcriptional regulator [Simplicispira hankyongi]|uniref:Helix-turn-helix domain-containing protein n=1 Tax=Simplicispira hankyongi TaxID=2315688 RepID=A0A398CFN1_9BURK|nr:helix-turn-helix domain-containing protein [Simplicispira hankyongi]RID99757.1 helix-turn-helix domain-containing protein [Simplicispira hankyongi]
MKPPAPAPVHVWFALLPGSLALDWAGPAEALRSANAQLVAAGQAERFVLHFAAPSPVVASSVGVQLAGLVPLPGELPAPSWVIVVGMAGGDLDVSGDDAQQLLHWLRGLRLRQGQLELLTVCAGAVLAAHAGLLAGRRATTHHQHLEELARTEPRCDVVANRVFVADGALYSSAGVSTGMDLVLHRIAQICGPAVAAQVAQTLVLALRRGPDDPQISPFMANRNHLHAGVHRVQDAVCAAPQATWSVPAMADIAHTSPRHLTRLFLEHAEIAPLAWLRRIRLARAEALLHAGQNVTQAAEGAGFASDTQLRRAWRQFGRPGSPAHPPASSAA